MGDIERALNSFRNVLGAENVIVDPQILAEYATTTFATNRRIPAALRPGSQEDVQAIVRIANECRVQLYTFSTGKNYGLGSRVPSKDGCFAVDLGRMNKILEFNEELCYVRVEAGVSFIQLSRFLQERNASVYLPATGGPPYGSPCGNGIERGDGLGPGGDRSNFMTNLEVVLPNGELLKTGFGAFENSKCANLAAEGPGPGIASLFFQSNLGIVTKLTLWLRKKPRALQVIVFGLNEDKQLYPVVENLRALQEQTVIHSNALAYWNWVKLLQSEAQYPYDRSSGTPKKVSDLRSRLPKFWRDTRWFCATALYSESYLHALADRRLVIKALKRHASQLFVFDGLTARVMPMFQGIIKRSLGIDITRMTNTFYWNPIYLGVPSEINLRSTYWRKKTPVPPPLQLNPDKDRCGAFWNCHVMPNTPQAIEEVGKIIDATAYKHGFEPNIAIMNPSQWYLRVFAITNYDREEAGEDDRAYECQSEMCNKLHAAGYTPYRYGIQTPDQVAYDDPEYLNIIRSLKQSFDPNDILSPNHYDFRSRWPKNPARFSNNEIRAAG